MELTYQGVVFEKRSCAEHGTYSVAILPNGVSAGCPACFEASEKLVVEADVASIARDAAAARNAIATASIGIPMRFKGRTLSKYEVRHGQQQRNVLMSAVDFVRNFTVEEGHSMFLFGGTGCGKTHIAAAIAMGVVSRGFTAKFVSLIGFLSKVKSTYSPSSPVSYDEIMDLFCSPDLLVIDDVGIKMETSNDRSVLYDLINRRYQDEKSIVLTSNLNIDELLLSLEEPVMSRLQDRNGLFLRCQWPSHRAEVQA